MEDWSGQLGNESENAKQREAEEGVRSAGQEGSLLLEMKGVIGSLP